MASTSCTSSATATTTSLLTTDVVTTTFTDSVSTAPASTTTITTAACALNITAIPCVSTATTITSTIAGSVTTIQVPVTSTVATTETNTITLFATSCTTIFTSASAASSPDPPSSGSGSAAFVGSESGSAISLFTPPASTFTTSSATTLSNGQVSEIMQTITSSPPVSTLFVGPTAHVAQDNNGKSSSPRLGAILGGIVGGFFGLLFVALGIWYLMKRRRRWDDIFEKDIDAAQTPRANKRFSVDAEIEPKPYQYGLVGQTKSPTVGISPSGSPPPSSHHNLTPLLLPTTASTPGPSATTMSSRPSTAGSMRPLRDAPGQTHHHTTSSGSSTSVQHVSPAMPMNQWGHHGPSPSTDQAYFDHARSGSLPSVQEYEMPHRRLQLANVGDDELMGASPPTPSLLRNPDPGPAMLDGKGRNVRLGSGGPGVLVHTDAGPANPPGFTP
ncbi:hypothetical protein C8F04DRAFT_1265007 [Mycena alexandri]|uniref:Uncharacterized protein n=1 Tax=Mycena alexandri TaxID=1745969 RepID=A0AAD6WZK8_9AGAR|nr:hypothetical protein C8F04DRAFT_1265007 [Mycena alexandri]